VLSWVEDLRRASVAVAKKKARPASARQQLFYVLKWTTDRRRFGIELRKGKYPESAEEWWKVDRALVTPPQFVNDEDLAILRLIWAERGHETRLRAYGLGPKHGAEILQRMADSHRLYPEDDLGLPLRAGTARPASIGWQVDANGFQRPCLKPEPGAELVVAVDPPWYVDLDEGEAGPLEVAGSRTVLNRLFSLPPLSAKEAALVAEALSELAPDCRAGRGRQRPPAPDRLCAATGAPARNAEHPRQPWRRSYAQSFSGGEFDVARVSFRYGEADVRPDERGEFVTLPEAKRSACSAAPTPRPPPCRRWPRPAWNASRRTRCTPSAARPRASTGWPTLPGGRPSCATPCPACGRPAGRSNFQKTSATTSSKWMAGMPNWSSRKTAGSTSTWASWSKANGWRWPRCWPGCSGATRAGWKRTT
jgi:hypothetical protein